MIGSEKKQRCTGSVAISIPDGRPGPESEKECEGLHNFLCIYVHAGFSEFIGQEQSILGLLITIGHV